MAQPTVQKNYRLPYPLVQQLEKYCKEQGITETSFIVEAIVRKLKEDELNE